MDTFSCEVKQGNDSEVENKVTTVSEDVLKTFRQESPRRPHGNELFKMSLANHLRT